MKRTFIYTDDKSNKFWTIETNGNSYTVNYGKVGTAGQTQEKSFDDEAACIKAAEKLIAEKTKKGYIEQSVENQNTTEQKNAQHRKVSKEVVVEADTSSGYGYLVDLEDKESIEHTLKAVIKHLDSDEILEMIDNSDMLHPEYGKMDIDNEFIEHERHPYRSSEDRFFSKAVSYPELRPLVVKYVKKIIKLNNEYDTIWANDETQAGVNAAFNLIEESEEYLPLYVELVKSCSDGEHDVYQFEHAQTILEKYGWKAETLPVIVQRVLVDIYAGEFFKSDAAKEFLSNEWNINTLINIFFKEIKSTHFADRDFYFKSFAGMIFSENEAEEYGMLLFDYAQKGKTPTLAMLKKGGATDSGSKKTRYNSRDYSECVGKALSSMGISDSGKINGSDGIQYYKGISIYDKKPVLSMYLSGVTLTYTNGESKDETFKLFNDIYMMLPPDLTMFLYIPGYSTFATANSVKYFTPDLFTDVICEQFYTLFGFTDYMAKELRQFNAGKKSSEEVLNSIREITNNIQLHKPVNLDFENLLKKYIEKIKSITLLKHDAGNHSFCLESNNPKTGKKAVGVVTYHPHLKKASLVLPCYQGDMKGREEEVYEWCEQATKQIDGHVINSPQNNYVMVRHLVNEYVITDAKSLQKYLLFDLLDCFAPSLAPGIQRIIDGEEPMDVLDDQLVYPESDADIKLPADLKELGIYGEQGERMLLAFNKYGKEFLKK